MQATDQRAQEDVCGMSAAHHSRGEEVHEVGLIAKPDAIINPGTMVVHAHHTSVALAAVVRSWGFEALADFAVLQEGLLFGLLKGNDTERVNYRIVITVQVGILKSVLFIVLLPLVAISREHALDPPLQLG